MTAPTMFGKELQFLEYVKAFSTHLPRTRKRQSGKPTDYHVGVLLQKLELRDIYISCEFARYIVDLDCERYWMRLLMPVLVINIKYMQTVHGVEPCEQTHEHHKWLESLKHNHPHMQKQTQKTLESKLNQLPSFQLDDDTSLRYLNVLNVYRELSHSPMEPWWWFDFGTTNSMHVTLLHVSAYANKMQTGMLHDLPGVINNTPLMKYVEKLFPQATIRLEKKSVDLLGNDTLGVRFIPGQIAFTPGLSAQALARAQRSTAAAASAARAVAYAQQLGLTVNTQSLPTVHNVPRGLGKTSSVMHATASTPIQAGQAVVLSGRVVNQIHIDEISEADALERIEANRIQKALQVRLATQKQDKLPRGSFAAIPGHNSVEPWKNKGKRGRIK